jgi:1-acyl-sn-glycerol-3-phosphate acyltransferase
MLRSAAGGVLVFVLFCLNTLFWGVPLYLAALLKLMSRAATLRRWCDALLMGVSRRWVDVNLWLVAVSQDIRWDIQGNADIDPPRSYLVISNHQSWVDIIVLLQALHRRAPFPRFFTKQQLVWVPILGQAFLALDFPLMKRFSAEQLRKQPELRGKDLETARRACAKFRDLPTAIINFAEGTRFRTSKHVAQQSPFTHLLKPKTGGVALSLAALGPNLAGVLDVTIVYPSGRATFPRLFAGRIDEVIVRVEKLPVPAQFSRGVERLDAALRDEVRDWIWGLWKRKDARIQDLLREVKRLQVASTNPLT